MLNFNAYGYGRLQDFKTFLNQCEAGGVTDIRFVRQQLEEHLNGEFAKHRKSKSKIRPGPLEKCPSCGQGWLVPVVNHDGLTLTGCKQCRFSKIAD